MIPVKHYIIREMFSKYKKELKILREIIESNDENMVISGWKRLRYKMKAAYSHIVKLIAICREFSFLAAALQEECRSIEAARNSCYNELVRYQEAKQRRIGEALFTPEMEREIVTDLKRKQQLLVTKKKKVDNLEQEYIIKQEELEIAIRDTNLAKSSYYHLTDAEIELFKKDREKILKGVETYGSISLACKKDPTIKTRVSSIMYHAKKHKQFGEDLELAKQVFRERLDATMIERALEGTLNPVFQKGQYIGDYQIKDNKLLVEVAKAKLPQEYNPRVYAAANPKGNGGTTINIVSFDGVDETKHGYVKNIGVVKSVDDTGRVERITQSKKMLEFYKEKGTAEIIEGQYERVEEDKQ